jgi:hypothetical protein
MNKPDEWSKAENDNSFLVPEIGTAWTKIVPEEPEEGFPLYGPGRWNLGVIGDGDYYWYKIISFGTIISFHLSWVPDHNWSDKPNDFLMYGGNIGNTYVELQLYEGSIYPSLLIAGDRYLMSLFVMDDYSAGDKIDITVLFDVSDPQKVRLFWNAGELVQIAEWYDLVWPATSVIFALGSYGSPGVIDNPKVFNLYKLLQADIDFLQTHESWQAAPGGRVLMPRMNRARGIVI